MFSLDTVSQSSRGTYLGVAFSICRAVGDDNQSDVIVKRRSGIDILFEGISQGALHNSGERFDPPKCHPNTRVAVLKKIMDWIQDQDPSSPDFMWIYGPAGSGKSAIAQTIAELCFKLGLLLGTFFFSRSVAGRNDDKRLVATIAYQIALSFSEARPLIEKAVEHDPVLLSRALEVQLKALIIDPLRGLSKTPGSHTGRRPCLIIIDGLDECQDPRVQTTIIRSFTQLVTLHRLPFVILFASRTEYHIREAFGDKAFETNLCRIALDNALWSADDDIRKFLTSRFKKIRDTHQMKFYIPQLWPPSWAIDDLVAKSSGQFIYASTVVKYVEAHDQRPKDRLNAVLALRSIDNETPFAELDALHRHILSSVENYGLVSGILGFLLLPVLDPTQIPDHIHRPGFITDFFSLQEGSVHLALSNLHSIMKVPEPDDGSSNIEMFHASFGDFLYDPSRSGIYFVEPSRVHADLAIRCMQNVKHARSDGHSYRALMEHCSRARLIPELLESLNSLDLRDWVSFTKVHECPQIAQSLPRYFTWLSNQIDTGAQEVLKRHIEAFDQCLLSEIREYRYNDDTIWCYAIFKGYLSLEESASLLGVVENVPERTLFAPCFLIKDGDRYGDFLHRFFFDNGRAGRNAITQDSHVRIMLMVLERLKSASQWAVDSPSFETELDIEACVTRLPIALSRVPSSNDIFGCVRSILSELEREHSSLDQSFRNPEIRAALSDYLQRSKDNIPLSFQRPLDTFSS